MTHTTYNDFIGLEDIEKKRGLIEFSVNKLEYVKLETQLDFAPKTKQKTEIIIIRDGKNKRAGGKGTELF
jgi:hypothetical protein